MKVQTANLTGVQLDWVVAKCEGVIWAAPDGELLGSARGMDYSTDWSLAGPIIEREKYVIQYLYAFCKWEAYHQSEGSAQHGPTPLIAAMRTYTASKLGKEVEVPDGLT